MSWLVPKQLIAYRSYILARAPGRARLLPSQKVLARQEPRPPGTPSAMDVQNSALRSIAACGVSNLARRDTSVGWQGAGQARNAGEAGAVFAPEFVAVAGLVGHQDCALLPHRVI